MPQTPGTVLQTPLDSSHLIQEVLFSLFSAWLALVSLPLNTLTTLLVDSRDCFISSLSGFLITATSSRAEPPTQHYNRLLIPKEEEVWAERQPRKGRKEKERLSSGGSGFRHLIQVLH